jgi:DNA-binding MarR family transcriptional regulator
LEENRQALVATLGQAVRDYQRATDAMDETVARRFGVNGTDLHCLDVLFDGPRTAGKLAEGIGLSPAATTTLIDRLEARGYVRRVRDPADRRRVLVELTEQARDRADEMYGPLAAEGAQLALAYTPEQLAFLLDYLREARELVHRHVERIRADESGAPTAHRSHPPTR